MTGFAPIIFSPEKVLSVATQAIYQDGDADASPVAGVASGILILVDRTLPSVQQWQVLRKHDQALVLWRFDDMSAGSATIEFMPASALAEFEHPTDVTSSTQFDRLQQVAVPQVSDDWQVLSPIGERRLEQRCRCMARPVLRYQWLVAGDGNGCRRSVTPVSQRRLYHDRRRQSGQAGINAWR